MRDSGWSIFDDDIPYLIAVMKDSALAHNGTTMREFCERNDVDLAPHGKTTMSPELFQRQIDDGAWAITAATPMITPSIVSRLRSLCSRRLLMPRRTMPRS